MKTLEIYRGAVVFIVLQLVGLAIAGAFPPLVNYLPNRVYLTSDTAPPPMNPKLQHCMEEYVFAQYDENGDALRSHIDRAAAMDAGFLPDALRKKYERSFELARAGIDGAQAVRAADAATQAYLPEYQPLHVEVRRKQADLRKLEKRLERLERDRSRLSRDETATEVDRERVERALEEVQGEMAAIAASIPATWEGARARYVELQNAQKKTRRQYRQSVDEAYQTVADLRALAADADALRAFEPTLAGLDAVVANELPEQAMETIKAAERELGKVAGSSGIRGRLSKARRALRGNSPKPEKAAGFLAEARERYAEEVEWRTRAAQELAPGLAAYDDAIRHSIGLRVQDRLTQEQARLVAECQSVHRDVSLHF